MHWIAPFEKDDPTAGREKRLWDAADQLRANAGLEAQECSGHSPQGERLVFTTRGDELLPSWTWP